MAKTWRIPLEEFAARVQEVIDRIIQNRETVVVESNGEEVVTIHAGEPESDEEPSSSDKSDEDYQAFLSSAGSWKDIDVEEFLDDIYASRNHGSRPPVKL